MTIRDNIKIKDSIIIELPLKDMIKVALMEV